VLASGCQTSSVREEGGGRRGLAKGRSGKASGRPVVGGAKGGKRAWGLPTKMVTVTLLGGQRE